MSRSMIPDDLVETVDEWRQKLVESVAEYDDAILEKFFEDPDSITKEEMMTAIRKAVIDLSFSPVLVGSAFKNKGVQALLDAVCAVSAFTHWICLRLRESIHILKRKRYGNPIRKNLLQPWPLKLQRIPL